MASLAEVHAEMDSLIDALCEIPRRWDGKTAIQTMKDADDRNWRQMEWIGFYGEFIARPLLARLPSIRVPGERFGNVSFDISGAINWDLKTHPNSSAGVILNDQEAVLNSLDRHGYHGFIVFAADCEFDDGDGSFKKWHDDLKGGRSAYEMERVSRGAPSRRRKTAARLTAIHFLIIEHSTLSIFESAQKGWRNSDGSPRRGKFSVTHEALIQHSRTVDLLSD